MSDAERSKRPKKQPTGDYQTGYCRPPVHSRVKEGQVLNPHGRNGKPVNQLDAFEEVRQRLSRVTIDGETVIMPSEKAYWLRTMAAAMTGNSTASRIIAKELAARRQLGPAPLTAEELAQQKTDEARRQELSATLVRLLEEKAARKRMEGPPGVRYGPDGRAVGTSDAI